MVLSDVSDEGTNVLATLSALQCLPVRTNQLQALCPEPSIFTKVGRVGVRQVVQESTPVLQVSLLQANSDWKYSGLVSTCVPLPSDREAMSFLVKNMRRSGKAIGSMSKPSGE